MSTSCDKCARKPRFRFTTEQTSVVIDNLSNDEVRDLFIKEQKSDDKIAAIREQIDTDTMHTIVDGIVMKKRKTFKREYHDSEYARLVPKSLTWAIIHHFHHTTHLGRARTKFLVKKNHTWTGMYQDIAHYMSGCTACRKRKQTQVHRAGLRQSMPTYLPLDRIAIDLVGPLPDTDNDNSYVLTMVDPFTKWPIAVPIPNKEAKTVARALLTHLIQDHGCPRVILSDQGTEFKEAVEELCRMTGIRKITTSAWTPRGNGHVERFHRYMGASLTLLVNKYERNWDDCIPPMLLAYRTSVHATTGYSPYYTLYGRHPRLPTDLTSLRTDDSTTSVSEYARAMSTLHRDIYRDIRTRQRTVDAKNRARQNDHNNRFATDFGKGDTVLLHEPRSKWVAPFSTSRKIRRNAKLLNRWSGPHVIVKRNSSVTYTIKHHGRGRDESVNISRLVLYNPWDEQHMQRLTKELSDAPLSTHDSCNDAPEKGTVGDLVAVRMQNSLLPFEIARILDMTGEKLHIQWYGNHNDNLNGTQRPGWLQRQMKNKEMTTKHYYRKTRRHHADQQYTDLTCNTTITQKHIIAAGFKLTPEERIPAHIFEMIAADKTCTWTFNS
jgi:hypothetical protein